MKVIICYRQGGNWIANVNGHLTTLHYSIQSKKRVIEWGKNEYEDYKIEFAE